MDCALVGMDGKDGLPAKSLVINGDCPQGRTEEDAVSGLKGSNGVQSKSRSKSDFGVKAGTGKIICSAAGGDGAGSTDSSGTLGNGRKEDIENCTPPTSPLTGMFVVEGVRREPRAKMSVSPSKAASDAIAAAAAKHAASRKVLLSPVSRLDRPSPAFTEENSGVVDCGVEVAADIPSTRSKSSSRAVSEESETCGQTSTVSMRPSSETGSDAGSSRSSVSPCPTFSHRARKSVPTLKIQGRRNAERTNEKGTGGRATPVPMTLQLREIEKTLGIKTLNNIDAKTLDKLILEKARMPRKDPTNTNISELRGSSPSAMSSVTSAVGPERPRMVSILKKNNLQVVKNQQEQIVEENASPAEVPNEGLAADVKDKETTTGSDCNDVKAGISASEQTTKGEMTKTAQKKNVNKKRRRKRCTGNYDLPSVSKKKKKSVPKMPAQVAQSKGVAAGVAKACPQPVISAISKQSLEDSYETVEEYSVLDSSHASLGNTSQAIAAEKPAIINATVSSITVPACSAGPIITSTPVLQRPKEGIAVLGKCAQSLTNSTTSTGCPVVRSTESKPVLGNKALVSLAAAVEDVQKSSCLPRLSEARKNQGVKDDTSEDSDTDSHSKQVIINPKTKRPYVRGPYKKRKSKCDDGMADEAEDDENGDVGTREETEEMSKSSSNARRTLPILEVLSKKLAQEQKTGAEDILDSQDRGSSSPKDGQQASKKQCLSDTTLLQQQQQQQQVTVNPKYVQDFFKTKMKPVTTGGTACLSSGAAQAPSKHGPTVSKPQRSVVEMFSQIRRKESIVTGKDETTTPEVASREKGSNGQTVNTATQVEDKQAPDPLILLHDPAIKDLPSKKDKQPTTLAELKATLDAEAVSEQNRKRKRNRRDDGFFGEADQETASLRSVGDDESGKIGFAWKAKRRKQENDVEQADDINDAEFLGVKPLVSPSKTQISSKVDSSSISAKSAGGGMGRSSSSGSLGAARFVNTPNGVLFPVTPPKTPDENSNITVPERGTPQLISPLARERDFLPLCCCRINGASFSHNHSVLYCQALDSIDGKVVGCCNKVTCSQLVRPALKIPFMAICEVHRKRLKLHQCCPGCGHFCTQGRFYQCKKESSSVVHHFHRQCQIFKDNKYYCPHCGEESSQYEVTLCLQEPRSASFISRTPIHLQSPIPHARLGSSTRPTHTGQKMQDEKECRVSIKISADKEISTAGLKFGPSKTQLANAIALLGSDKPKKLRTGPKSLYYGAKSGDLERVIFMLADGCDPNHKNEDQGNQTAMHAAAYFGSVALIHVLVQAGGNIHLTDDTLYTPLLVAAEQGHREVVAYLLAAGAVGSVKADDGMMALHLAAKSGHLELCKFLAVDAKMNINAKDDGGWTPLIWAAEHKNNKCVKFLLDIGADPNLCDNEENTALHWAVYAGSVDIAELFLNWGCDMECPNEHGDRALHIAARQDHYECVVLLLARGADSEARNNENETPLACCADTDSPLWMTLKINRELKGFANKRHYRPQRLLHRDISIGRESNPVPVVNDIDDENYPQDFHYVTENVETSPMMVNRVITSLQACQCKDDCSSIFCVCGRTSVRCWYNKEGRLVDDFNQIEPPLIFECNKACKCWSTCQNRVVQLGITCRLQVFRTSGRGWGVRAQTDVKQGTFICEYIGEHISDAEADAREDDSYLFDLDNKDTDTFCIDARRYANVARFINHLCEPNLIPVKVFIEHQDLRFPRICFFASRDIIAGEELGFDYGEKFWIIKWKQFTCACKSPKCKYSSETIHKTIEEYNRRQEEDAFDADGV